MSTAQIRKLISYLAVWTLGLAFGAFMGESIQRSRDLKASLASISEDKGVPLRSVIAAPGSFVQDVGLTQHVSAHATYADGTTIEVTDVAQWRSDNPTVVVLIPKDEWAHSPHPVGIKGVMCISAGESNISARFGNAVGNFMLTCSPVSPPSGVR